MQVPTDFALLALRTRVALEVLDVFEAATDEAIRLPYRAHHNFFDAVAMPYGKVGTE
jgi:hypothetical protein